jgi:predicted YcjX-like family ATPase
VALGAIPGLAADLLQMRSTKRIGVTGLARAGKAALITSLAANLLALSAHRVLAHAPKRPIIILRTLCR